MASKVNASSEKRSSCNFGFLVKKQHFPFSVVQNWQQEHALDWRCKNLHMIRYEIKALHWWDAPIRWSGLTALHPPSRPGGLQTKHVITSPSIQSTQLTNFAHLQVAIIVVTHRKSTVRTLRTVDHTSKRLEFVTWETRLQFTFRTFKRICRWWICSWYRWHELCFIGSICTLLTWRHQLWFHNPN